MVSCTLRMSAVTQGVSCVCVRACVQCPVLAAASVTWIVGRKVAWRGVAWPSSYGQWLTAEPQHCCVDLRSGDTIMYTLFFGYCVHVAVLLHSTELSLFGNFLSGESWQVSNSFHLHWTKHNVQYCTWFSKNVCCAVQTDNWPCVVLYRQSTGTVLCCTDSPLALCCAVQTDSQLALCCAVQTVNWPCVVLYRQTVNGPCVVLYRQSTGPVLCCTDRQSTGPVLQALIRQLHSQQSHRDALHFKSVTAGKLSENFFCLGVFIDFRSATCGLTDYNTHQHIAVRHNARVCPAVCMYDLYCLRNVWNRVRLAGHVARTERRTNKAFWWGNLKENDPLKDIEVVRG